MAMIEIYIRGTLVCTQMQMDDYLNPPQRNIKCIIRYRRVNISKTIKVCTSAQKPAKYLIKRRIHRLYEIKLERIIPNLLIALGNNPFQALSLDSLTKHIPVIEISLEENQTEFKQEGPFLFTYPYMHLDRFNSIPSVSQEDFGSHPLLINEWKYYQEVEAFTGLFQHMILLNSFAYWDTVETELREAGWHPKGFTVVEFIKWEFLRHSLGISSYSDAQRIFSAFNPELLKGAFDRPTHIPAPYHASYYYKWLKPIHFQTFFQKLVDDCVKYKIIIPRIAIADGLIFRTWAGNFTLDQWMQPTDPGATITVHNKKHLGKCYNGIVYYAWCGTRWLPVDLRVITGSANENSMFELLTKDFLEKSSYDWDVFLYDSGACSADNRQFLKVEGLIPGITARKNIIREVVLDIDHKRYCFADDIPDGMSLEQYKRLLNHRSQEEAGFSGFTTYHHMKQMNTTGHDGATIHVLKYLCLQLLHALAAYKVNRPDLLMMFSAFSSLE